MVLRDKIVNRGRALLFDSCIPVQISLTMDTHFQKFLPPEQNFELTHEDLLSTKSSQTD